MLITKKKHKKKIEFLTEQHIQELERMKALYEMADRDSREWRKKFELLQLTPEIKADTEGAFRRGAHDARRKLANALMTYAAQLTQGDTYEAD